jgi:hypothetical protein
LTSCGIRRGRNSVRSLRQRRDALAAIAATPRFHSARPHHADEMPPPPLAVADVVVAAAAGCRRLSPTVNRIGR